MIDVSKPVTNPDLVKAIHEMRKNNSNEKQDVVINKMMKAHFISPVTIAPTPTSPVIGNETVLKKDTEITFHMIENSENQKFILAFTDWDELRKWQTIENQQTLIVTFDDLGSMMSNENGNADGFVINPFNENILMSKSRIQALMKEKERLAKGGVVEQIMKKETTVLLGQPKTYPKQLVNAIADHLKNQKNVKAAYLQLMMKEEEQSYLVVIDFAGDKREVFDGVGKVAMQYLNGMYIDMVPYDSQWRNAVKGVQPFYKRKLFGLF